VNVRGGLRAGRWLPLLALPVCAVTLALPAAPPETAEAIVERHIAARGGLAKIRSIQSLRQKGHVIAGADREGLVTRELMRPGKSRFEFRVQGVTAVYVSDGRNGWRVSPFDGDVGPTPLSDEAVQEAAEQADIEGPLVEWQAKGHQVELVGRETVGGREAYKLKLTLKSGAVLDEYIDVKSLYLVRTDSTRQVRGRAVQIETTFANYKKTVGVAFPRLIEVVAAGRPQRLRITVDEVEVNPPLSEARFETAVPSRP